MAVDSLSKRSAALGFGSPWRSGTRPPSGSVTAFDRGALLGCYYLEPVIVTVVPAEGWQAGYDSVAWSSEYEPVVWNAGYEPTVWSVDGDCCS